MRRPGRCGDQVLVGNGLVHGNIDECSAGLRDIRRDRRIATDLSSIYHAGRSKYLRRMTDRRKRLLRGSEMPHGVEYFGVQPKIFRSLSAGNDESVIVVRLDVIKCGVQREIVAALF